MKHIVFIGIILLLLIGVFVVLRGVRKESQTDFNSPSANLAEKEQTDKTAKNTTPELMKLQKKLDSIIIENLKFEDSSVSSVICELRKEAKTQDPEGKGVNIVLLLNPAERKSQEKIDKNSKKNDVPDDVFMLDDGSIESDQSAASNSEKPIVTIFDDLSLRETIRNICIACDLKYRIDKNAVLIADKNIPLDSLETEIFPLSDDADLISKGKQIDSGITDLKEFFKNQGVSFTDGTEVVYDESISRLTATAPPKQMKRIKAIVDKLNTVDPEVIITARFVKIPECEYRRIKCNKETKGVSVEEQIIRSEKCEIIASETVITQNGEEANLSVGKKIYYPDSWSEALAQSDWIDSAKSKNNATKEKVTTPNTGAGQSDASNIMPLNGTVITTSASPEFSEPENLGISMYATPTVDPDQYRITIDTVPQIRYFSGWTFYGKQMKMPKIGTWNISSQYQLNDGDTVTAGSFIEDVVNKSNGKHTRNRFLLLLTTTLIHTDGVPLRDRSAPLNPAERECEDVSVTKKRSNLELKLDKIIIDRVNYKNADIATVVKDLVKKTKLNLVLGLDELECERIPHVTLDLNDIPFSDLLSYISLLAKLQYRCDDNFITIGNESLCPMESLYIKVRRELINRISPNLLNDSINTSDEEVFFEPGKESFYDYCNAPIVKKYFSERGISFPEGSSMKYSKSEGKLLVKNTKENLERLKALFGWPSDLPQVMVEGTMVEIDNDDLVKLIGRNAALSDNLTQRQIEKIIDSPKGRILASHTILGKSGEELAICNGSESCFSEAWSIQKGSVKDGYICITKLLPEFGNTTLIGSQLIVTPIVSPDLRVVSLALNPLYQKLSGWSEYETYIDINSGKGNKREAGRIKMPEFRLFQLAANMKISDGLTLMAGKSQLLDLSLENNTPSSSLTEQIEKVKKQKRKLKTIFYFVNAKIVKEQ